MTKKKALAISRALDTQCDEPYMFAVKIGAGCFQAYKSPRSGLDMLTLFINLIEMVMQNLRGQLQDDFVKLLSRALQDYLSDNYFDKPQEVLSGKLLARRIKNNEKIISTLDNLI